MRAKSIYYILMFADMESVNAPSLRDTEQRGEASFKSRGAMLERTSPCSAKRGFWRSGQERDPVGR